MPSTKILLGDSNVSKTAIQKRYCIAGQKVDKFFAALIQEIEVERRQLGKGLLVRDEKRFFLMNKFCGVHLEFIDKMLNVFGRALVPVSIACFFVENGYANKLQKLHSASVLRQSFWLRCAVPLQQKRKQKNQFVPAKIKAEFARYTHMMRKRVYTP